MPDTALVDEVANELETWPGVRIERVSEREVIVHYEQLQLGVLDSEHATAELRFSKAERDELVEHGDAEPIASLAYPDVVAHEINGPSDVTAVLELFDRRYRDLRGEDEPYTSRDSG